MKDQLDLKNAFSRVESDLRDDVLPDVVGFRDFKINLDENLEAIQKNIAGDKKYLALPPLLIEKPKTNYAVRPGIVPDITDRVTYQAIADFYAKDFKAEPNIYSNQLNHVSDKEMFKRGVETWLQFQNAIQEGCSQYEFVVETDLTAFFDHINHPILERTLLEVGKEAHQANEINQVNNILHCLLSRWSTVIYLSGFGIPQINDASSFFAQVYMDPFDKWCDLQEFHYCRYVDDMRFFCASEAEARETLVKVITKLREMGLYTSSKKTNIQDSRKVLEETLQHRKEITQIEGKLTSGSLDQMEAGASELFSIFEDVIENTEEINTRLFRLCINRFKRIAATGLLNEKHAMAIQASLSRLKCDPDSTDVFIDYWSVFPDNEQIQISVINFLESPDNVYPWQSMKLLELLVRMNITSKNLKRVKKISNQFIFRKRNPGEVSQAAILLGKNGNYADRETLATSYSYLNSEYVNRAIVLSVQELSLKKRNRFYSKCGEDSNRLLKMTEYVKTFSQPRYHYFNPPNPYPLTRSEDSDDLFELGSDYFS